MSVTFRIPTILRPYIGGESTIAVEPEGNQTLFDAITALEVAAPGISARIIDDNGALRRFVNVYIGDDDVRFLDGLATPIAAGSTISIIPAVAGGC